jgi:hypothetical protein
LKGIYNRASSNNFKKSKDASYGGRTMTHTEENGILVDCDECIININKKINDKKKFRIKDFRNDKKKSREEALEFIIGRLYDANDCMETPQSCRKNITKLLLNHGQFRKNEIDEIFNRYSHESTNYTIEFIRNHPKIDFMKLNIADNSLVKEVKYNFPIVDCDYIRFIGFCKFNVEILRCPDCGNEVSNTPSNRTFGYEHNLVCPICLCKKVDEFDTRGLVKVGNPVHHGHWETQKPELVRTDTDYFAILHPKCKKSKRKDGKGFMEVNGVWVDDCGRVVLSLECVYCGARNALKPFTREGGVPLLNESGAEWRRIESPILEIIRNGENAKVEFKSSLRWDYKNKRFNRELEWGVIDTIASYMNSEGGILLIGVEDSGKVLGLKRDYSTLGRKKNRDGFELLLTDLINNYIGKEIKKFAKVEFASLNGNEICYVEVIRSPKPVFVEKNGKKVFVIRSGNRTQTLDPRETLEYCKMHWKK